MANYIYNSARRLFSEASINWPGTTNATWGGGYKIYAALVNTTGSTGIGIYPTSYQSITTDQFVAGTDGGSPTSGVRNMHSEFGFGSTGTNCKLIRGNSAGGALFSNGSGSIYTVEVASRSVIAGTGSLTAANIKFASVLPDDAVANGGTNSYLFGAVESIVIYLMPDSAIGLTDIEIGKVCPCLLYIDTISTGSMSIIPNGGDIVVQWSANGIFRL